MDESEFEERGRLIEQMLDKINPIPDGSTDEAREIIGRERQALVLKTDWGSMPIEQLRQTASQ